MYRRCKRLSCIRVANSDEWEDEIIRQEFYRVKRLRAGIRYLVEGHKHNMHTELPDMLAPTWGTLWCVSARLTLSCLCEIAAGGQAMTTGEALVCFGKPHQAGNDVGW